jgi:glycosyltransferase involved in cell wall biosynthesis
MVKYHVLGDPNNKHITGSTNIIVNSLNESAKKLGLYDENGIRIIYDCLGNSHNLNPDVTICVFEMPPTPYIRNNLGGKPVLGVSRDNARFLIEGGYNPDLVGYFCLGVDSNKYRYVYKKETGKPFRFLTFCESNSRGMLEATLASFCCVFSHCKDVELVIKDRQATDKWKYIVDAMMVDEQVSIIYDGNESYNVEDILSLASTADACISLNRSSTWDMKAFECLSMGLPSIMNLHSGHREYGIDDFSVMEVPSGLVPYGTSQLDNIVHHWGMNNYLFHPSAFDVEPYWSHVNHDDLEEKMMEMYQNSQEYRNKLSIGARLMAEHFTWERSAVNLSMSLSKWFK